MILQVNRTYVNSTIFLHAGSWIAEENEIIVKIHIGLQENSNLASDWWAEQPPANQKPEFDFFN